MSNYTDMPLDATLQQGDIVTISGPGEHDVLVREVTRLDAFDNSAIVAGMVGPTADMVVILGREGRTLTRVQRPVPALPAVEGDYILTMADGSRYVRSFSGGEWRDHTHKTAHMPRLREYVEAGATLTRVIPADEVKRPAADVEAATSAFLDLWVTPNGGVKDDFETVLRRVLKGEFDL